MSLVGKWCFVIQSDATVHLRLLDRARVSEIYRTETFELRLKAFDFLGYQLAVLLPCDMEDTNRVENILAETVVSNLQKLCLVEHRPIRGDIVLFDTEQDLSMECWERIREFSLAKQFCTPPDFVSRAIESEKIELTKTSCPVDRFLRSKLIPDISSFGKTFISNKKKA